MTPAQNKFTRAILPMTVAIAGISTTASAFSGGQFLYFGLNTGTSFINNSSHNQLLPIAAPAVTIREDFEQRGFNGGAFIGFNFLTCDRFLMAVELSGLYYSNRGHSTFDRSNPIGNFGIFSTHYEENFDVEYSLSATLRPGYLINDSTLLYFQAGTTYAWLNSELINLHPQNAAPYPTRITDKEGEWGATIGAGLQKQLSDCWSIFGAYQYTYYGKFHLTDGGEGQPGSFESHLLIQDREQRLTENTFKFGAIFTF